MKDFFDKEFHPTEMYKLINLLIQRKADFRVAEHFDTPMIFFRDANGSEIGDAICHRGSYGHENGELEIMGLDVTKEEYGDSVLGYLTAEEVLEHLDNCLKKGGENND